MEISRQLIIGGVAYTVTQIEAVHYRLMRITVDRPLPEDARRDKVAILVRGTSREPVRMGDRKGPDSLLVSLIY